MTSPGTVRPASVPRRFWLGATLAFGAGLIRIPVAAAAARDNPIEQPAMAAPKDFMDRAYDMKRQAQNSGDQAFGAVIALAGRIVGQAPSRVVVRRDPTAHAEMEAIRDAAQRLGRRDLTGATLYSSSRPCPMCEAAASLAGIERMVHGADLADAGVPRLGRC
jgi:tRNA(Arg) A34 adenosine deaminase TadA